MYVNEGENPKYSVVVPFHNEHESVRELYQQLSSVMTNRYEPVEFIFIDDHSTDSTPQVLNEIVKSDPRVVAIRLKRNSGQTVALAAGFDYAEGDVIISMDGDLQHDPADIQQMLAAFEETECDIVSGWRKKRVDNFLLRRAPSRVAKDTIKQIRLYGEMHRFIPALASWNGATIVEVPIKNIERPGGRSHYGLSRTVRVLFDLLTIRFLLKYVTRPLHFFGPIGLLSTTLGVLINVWLIVDKAIYGTALFDKHGPLMLLGAVLILAGVQLVSSGLIGEMLSRTYFESQGKPIYSIEKVITSKNASTTHS